MDVNYEKRELSASTKIKAELADLREKAVNKQWTFEVGYTTAMDSPIEKITGMKQPDEWMAKAKLQNSMAKPSAEQKKMLKEYPGFDRLAKLKEDDNWVLILYKVKEF